MSLAGIPRHYEDQDEFFVKKAFGNPIAGIVTPNDTPTSGTIALVALDANRNLKVNVVAGGGTGGTSSVDESGFTAGSSSGTPAMAENGGELLILSCDASRNLNVRIAAGSITVTPPTSATLNSQAQTTVGTSNVTLLSANSSRVRFVVQNVGTTRISITYGSTATVAGSTVVLPAGGTTGDGSSQPLVDTLWLGAVSAIGSGAGGSVLVSEFTP